ncbi:putative serine dehydratase domain-containing protein [Biscogniauxia marginata]|nr:putative serine dehydratase domain-containing protein [Biscogniauxia marginata]
MSASLPKDLLRAQFVGKTLHQVGTPALVLDLAKVEANCNLMLEAAQRLQLSWRAHIKTHKTEELTRLQVGDDNSLPVNIIVSTIIEGESVLPLLKEYQEKGRQVNVLYSFPIYGSSVARLAALSSALGPRALSVMVDHPDQLKHLTSLASKSGHPPLVFLKVNVGTNRAGVVPGSAACRELLDDLLIAESTGSCVLLGLYCHAGHSYAARRDWEAMGILGAEFAALEDVAALVRKERPGHPLVLSVGATPTATTLQHPDFSQPQPQQQGSEPGANGEKTASAVEASLLTSAPTSRLKELISRMRAADLTLEVHAGVYPTLDVQQLAAHARDAAYLNWRAIGVSVLADVASLYPGRGAGDSSTEALVNAGCLALGREPCQDMGGPTGESYNAWGILMPWNGLANPTPGPEFPAVHGGWQVARISQEHGVLRWAGPGGEEGGGESEGKGKEAPLHVGQRVRIWPNHSCITGAGHGWYLVVDSRNQGREDEIVDVWPRWNGW